MPLVLHYTLEEDHKGHFVEIEEKNSKGEVRVWRMIEGVEYKYAKKLYDVFDDMVEERVNKTSIASYGRE